MKKTAKKAAASKPAKAPEPMDDSVREHAVGTAPTNQRRVCWAIKTLVDEVHALFPETTVEYGDYDGRNTALSVAFDLTPLPAEDAQIDLSNLLDILGTDERVSRVVRSDVEVGVSMRSNPRTQDSREPFGLADAYLILSGDDDDEPGWVFEDDRPAPDFALDSTDLGGSL